MSATLGVPSFECASSDPGTEKISKEPASKEEKSNVQWRRKDVAIAAVGLLLVLASGIVYLVDPVSRIISAQTSVEEGTFIFEMWRKPPVSVFLYTYLFNITNADRFLNGEDKKLRVEQVGPYVYREILENCNATANPNGTLTYKPTYQLRFVRELSVGNPEEDIIITPNLILLGAASMLAKSSFVTNMGLRSLTAYLDSQPILRISVHELLWGYDDPLIHLANRVISSYIDFPRFGILDRMYAKPPGGNVATMRAGPNNGVDLNDPNPFVEDVFSLDTYDGSPVLPKRGFEDTDNSSCKTVRGAFEGLLWPRNILPEHSFRVYRKAFCRNFPVVFDKAGIGPGGFRSYWFKLKDDVMDPQSPDSSCVCDQATSTCPKGLTNMAPCYYNVPLFLSMPHLLFVDTKIRESIDGMNPDYEKHKTYLILQPDLGIPLEIHCRVQVNLGVQETKMHPRVKPFNNLVIPIIYIDFTVRDLPQDIQNLMTLALYVGPVVQTVVVALLALIGAAMLLVILRRRGTSCVSPHVT